VLAAGALANDAVLSRDGDAWTSGGDPTEVALLVAARKLRGAPPTVERMDELPFTAERKLMSTVVRPTTDGRPDDVPVLLTKGAPDVLLGRCSHERVAGVVRPLPTSRRAVLLEQVDGLADEGLRTLAMAYRRLDDGVGPDVAGAGLEQQLVYLGLVGIMDPGGGGGRGGGAEGGGNPPPPPVERRQPGLAS
jgi:P-type Ca2+ transporter type 2C